MTKPYEVKNERKYDFLIDEFFLKRWSPRSLSQDVSEEELMSLFEAVRWAPSSNNEQPWKFLYSINGSREWKDFFDLLGDFNKIWCKNAAFLLVLISRNNYTKKKDEKSEDCHEKPNKTHSFDTGSAWMSLVLQARKNNLIAHVMAGFDYEKAREVLNIPESFKRKSS
ncbi:nitroreductase [Candidatus Pacearchaeota archaeon CG10_big_fil_rev_8_21_14_0_10_32_14]|nr:MAG: nitroreductase [Candidatus Pacearchaeota archaeon CG10_big_fil_rev_8_21_14_0_10_32_14]